MTKKTAEERKPPSEETEKEEPKKSSQEDKGAALGAQAKEVVENVYHMARNVQGDTIAYIVLAIGLVLTPWMPLWGGALVGIVFGIYFCDEMLNRVKGFRNYLAKEGMAKTLVCAGATVAILIWLPTLVLGAVAAVGIMALVRRSTGT